MKVGRDGAHLSRHHYTSPLGVYLLISSKKGIVFLKSVDQERFGQQPQVSLHDQFFGSHEINLQAVEQLDAYFAGELHSFDLPLDLQGTSFQQQVWRALLRIPYGETCTYGSVAAAIGVPKAGRAVGSACNANPLSIIVPCHRVIGANGRLTGYGGGLYRKKALLTLETGETTYR